MRRLRWGWRRFRGGGGWDVTLQLAPRSQPARDRRAREMLGRRPAAASDERRERKAKSYLFLFAASVNCQRWRSGQCWSVRASSRRAGGAGARARRLSVLGALESLGKMQSTAGYRVVVEQREVVLAGDAAAQDSLQRSKAGRPQAKRADRDRRVAHSAQGRPSGCARAAAGKTLRADGGESQCAANAAAR